MEPMAIDNDSGENAATAMTLADLPTEVLCLVALGIHRGRDLVAWACATRAPIDDALVIMAIRCAATSECCASLIARGVPSAIAVRAWDRMGAIPHMEWLGRLERASAAVIDWVFVRLAQGTKLPSCCRATCPVACGRTTHFARWSPLFRHEYYLKTTLSRDAVAAFIGYAQLEAGAAALEQSARIGINVGASSIIRLMTLAVKSNRINLFDSLHTRLLTAEAKGKSDDWRRTIGKEIVACQAVEFAERACDGRYGDLLPHYLMDDALLGDKPRILRWMIAHAPKDARGRVCHQSHVMHVRTHIKRDRIDILSLAHDSGLWKFTGSTLAYAARRGCSKITRWAAGEGRDRGPTKAWRTGMAAYGIVESGDTKDLLWMLARPDAGSIINTGILRAAVVCGNVRRVAAIHDSGLASLSTWRALEVALESHDDPRLIEAICDRRARCDAITWCVAIKNAREASLSCLVGRFGIAHLQEAVNEETGTLRLRHSPGITPDPCRGMAWVRDNVTAVCVGQARRGAIASCTNRRLISTNIFTRKGCQCSRCNGAVDPPF
jgi:hypothetical protein